jgi:hypothetical protein
MNSSISYDPQTPSLDIFCTVIFSHPDQKTYMAMLLTALFKITQK